MTRTSNSICHSVSTSSSKTQTKVDSQVQPIRRSASGPKPSEHTFLQPSSIRHRLHPRLEPPCEAVKEHSRQYVTMTAIIMPICVPKQMTKPADMSLNTI